MVLGCLGCKGFLGISTDSKQFKIDNVQFSKKYTNINTWLTNINVKPNAL